MSSADSDKPASNNPHRAFDLPDTLLAIFLILSCAYFISLTYQFPEPSSFLGENVLPGHFPRLMLYTIAVLALLMPFEHRFSPERWPKIQQSRSAPIGSTAWITAVFIGILLALAPTIGTVLTILTTALVLPFLWGERRWLMVIIFAVVFTAIITYVFSIVLSVYFVPGVFNITLR